jgi:hypothetical protein
VAGSCVYGDEPSGSINWGNFLSSLEQLVTGGLGSIASKYFSVKTLTFTISLILSLN